VGEQFTSQQPLGVAAVIDFLRSLFWSDKRDLEPKHQTDNDRQARKLEMDEPMAGAGALLAGEHRKSETEKTLQRAADQNDS
jgi:hypothetical protein